MAKAEYREGGLCGLYHKADEGIQITVWRFVRVFICEGCISKLFRQFRKGR